MSGKTHSVLILGSGLCTPPLIRYLGEHGYELIVANRTQASAEKLISKFPKAKAVELDIENPEHVKKLDDLVPQVEAVVSMLPYLFHPIAAKVALKYKKHFFTTSYVSDALRSLDEEAKKLGVVMVNECGVDPGTDHMSAMKVINRVKADGGKITSFKSFCGALPAPDSNDNPFGYKFSWAPRGVLLASRNNALYLKDGADVTIDGKDLFDSYQLEEFPGIGTLEIYPNRNSKGYIDVYNIPEVKTMIRGTYRWRGWCPTIKKIADLGFLSTDEKQIGGMEYSTLAASLLGTPSTDSAQLKNEAAKKLNVSVEDKTLSNIEWLGLFSNEKIPEKVKTPLDALCQIALNKLKYQPGERDMIVMKHEFIAEYEDRREYITSSLIDFGIPNGETSISRTVALPVAIAIRLVLEGKVHLTGIQIPTIPELYEPILSELETLGIKFTEKLEKVEKK